MKFDALTEYGAFLTSQKATGGMIKQFSSKYPPAEYSIGKAF